MEHQDKADRLEEQADRLEHEGDRVGDHIEETRRDWEQKAQDQNLPGAQPEGDFSVDQDDNDDDDETET